MRGKVGGEEDTVEEKEEKEEEAEAERRCLLSRYILFIGICVCYQYIVYWN